MNRVKRKIKRFVIRIKNTWVLLKCAWGFRPFDYHYNLRMLRESLKLTHDYCDKHGWEVRETRDPKLQKMKRMIQLLENIENDEFDSPESDKYLNKHPQLFDIENTDSTMNGFASTYFNMLTDNEEKQWKELCEIFENDFRTFWD